MENIEYFNNNAYERYRDFAKKAYKSKQSANSRISAVHAFISFLNEKKVRVDEADHSIVDEFLNAGLESSLSRTTIQNRYSYIGVFFKFLKEQHDNLKMDYSKVNFKREKNTNFEVFTDSEIKEIFDIIDNERNKYSNRIIFKMLLYTGCSLKELDSFVVFFYKKDIPKNKEKCIDLESSKLFFDKSNEFVLPNGIMSDIKAYHEELKQLYKVELPSNMPLLVYYLVGEDGQGELVKLKYNSIQERMERIKCKSSFKDKKLSLKNLRHTVIKKMILENKDLAYISKKMRIDLSTLKLYLENDNEGDDDKDFLINHPFKEFIY